MKSYQSKLWSECRILNTETENRFVVAVFAIGDVHGCLNALEAVVNAAGIQRDDINLQTRGFWQANEERQSRRGRL